MEKIIKYIDSNKERYLEELKDFLRIPSISNEESHKDDVRKASLWLENHLNTIGLDNVKIFETEGHPIVYADCLKAGKDKPTVLVYGHYDVQPVDPLELWTNPPFEPTVKGNKIYARGSADDKGQIFIHIKSIEAHLKNNGKMPVNLKVIFEGEEEIGSVNLHKFLESQKELLKADYVVISDTSMYKDNMPSICYGLRGLCFMQIDIVGPNRDLHSGSFGGGVQNPINALADIINKLKDEKGHILIDNFMMMLLHYLKKKEMSSKDYRSMKMTIKKIWKLKSCSVKKDILQSKEFLQDLHWIAMEYGADIRGRVRKPCYLLLLVQSINETCSKSGSR